MKPLYSIRSRRGLLQIDRSIPSVAAAGWSATTWSTSAGAVRAIDRCRLYLQCPPVGLAAAAALALLDGCTVMPHDAEAEAWHEALIAARHRVEMRRHDMLAGLGAVVDAAEFVGDGATVNGVEVTPEMCAARIEAEIRRILQEGADNLSEDGLRTWVAHRRAGAGAKKTNPRHHAGGPLALSGPIVRVV
jgi:hypothetical protein